jgi:ubiquitin carboxyl-terminal hydrolase L5
MGDWCTIESDPGVFTELIRQIGVKGLEVSEIYSLDLLSDFSPVYGLIFLFKWEGSAKPSSAPFLEPGMFFANQVIQNACATQAMLSVLLNANVDLGDELTRFKEFAMPLDPMNRGYAISNSALIRTTHNSFAQQEPFEFSQTKKSKKGDTYHFVSYIWFNGRIFELDGLMDGPICHGECSEDAWVEGVKPIIGKRMEEFSGNEIRFNLLAIVDNKRDKLKKEFYKNQLKLVAVKTKLISLEQEVEGDEMESEFDEEYFMGLSDEVEELKSEMGKLSEEGRRQREEIEFENAKYEKWMKENQRRKHNYVPFICNLLEKLAEQKKLIPLMEAAKERKEKAGSK